MEVFIISRTILGIYQSHLKTNNTSEAIKQTDDTL